MASREGQSLGEKVWELMVWVILPSTHTPCLENSTKINWGTGEVPSYLEAEPRSEPMSPVSTMVLFQVHT